MTEQEWQQELLAHEERYRKAMGWVSEWEVRHRKSLKLKRWWMRALYFQLALLAFDLWNLWHVSMGHVCR